MLTSRTAVRRVLEITGLVQGVGFRPHVYRVAARHRLGGWVSNTGHGATLCVEGPVETIELFCTDFMRGLPELARIDSCEVLSEAGVSDASAVFEIAGSTPGHGGPALVTPDGHVCPDCLRELFDEQDRRFRYPFINCTNCGPRYSIIRSTPYDRPSTTMSGFAMCSDCRVEYESPADRRFHAQPIACWSCGPELTLLPAGGSRHHDFDPVAEAAEMLLRGDVLAVKGHGGYQLIVDARNSAAVARLRARKERGAKPFALLVRDAATAAGLAFLDDAEMELLSSPARPIVLLRARNGNGLTGHIAPGTSTLGLMLPATPVQHLLLAAVGHVLVATSGNLPGEPMAMTEQAAVQDLSLLADAFLTHDRDIHTRIDDSVARVVHGSKSNRTAIIRRARGYAPDVIPTPFKIPAVLALGAELKNTICFGVRGRLHLSQHIGDLKSLGNQEFFEQVIGHHRHLFGIEPLVVAHDLHPDFHSTRRAQTYSNVEKIAVQHHHAHMAACMADNGLDRPVIGVVYDGTGLGSDSTIWGGEFLVGDYQDFRRVGHLATFRLPGADRAVEEPWRVAVSLLRESFGDRVADLPLEVVRSRDPFELGVLLRMLGSGTNSPVTSSMGRFFDAISALLGVRHAVQYEAQAAIELENLIGEASGPPREPWPVRLQHQDGNIVLDHRPWIRALVDDLGSGNFSAPDLSRQFHDSVIRATSEICVRVSAEHRLTDVVLTGGVFQNMYLLVGVERELLAAGLRVHTHGRVPTSDAGLAIGQAMVAAGRLRSRPTTTEAD